MMNKDNNFKTMLSLAKYSFFFKQKCHNDNNWLIK